MCKKPGDGQGSVLPGGTFSMRNATLRISHRPTRSIRSTRGSASDLIVGAPAWADTDHFDIIGKGPANMPARDCFFSNFCLPNNTLATNAVRFWKRNLSWWSTRTKGPLRCTPWCRQKAGQGQEAAAPGDRNCQRLAPGSDNPARRGLTAIEGGFVCVNMTMSNLAALLPEMAGGYIHTRQWWT